MRHARRTRSDRSHQSSDPASAPLPALFRRFRSQAAVTLVETIVATSIFCLYAVGATQALLALNRHAASTRILTTAKEVVERNMEAAVGAPLTSDTTPAILAVTGSSGVLWDDSGGTNVIPLVPSRDGLTTMVSGTLRRTVALWNTTDNPLTRRITFRIDYRYNNRPMSYQLSTILSPDK